MGRYKESRDLVHTQDFGERVRVTRSGKAGGNVNMGIPPSNINPNPEDLKRLLDEVRKAGRPPDVVKSHRHNK